jgi:hypothetical protein
MDMFDEVKPNLEDVYKMMETNTIPDVDSLTKVNIRRKHLKLKPCSDQESHQSLLSYSARCKTYFKH